MKLEEEKEFIKNSWLFESANENIGLKEAIVAVLQELEHLQKENEEFKKLLEEIILGGEEKEKKSYKVGLIAGADREYKRWQNKIREKTEEIKKKPNNSNQKVIATQIDASLIACLEDLLKEE